MEVSGWFLGRMSRHDSPCNWLSVERLLHSILCIVLEVQWWLDVRCTGQGLFRSIWGTDIGWLTFYFAK